VVVPTNLLEQWKQEISKHTTGLSILIPDGKQELPPPEKLADYDIILFSSTRLERLKLTGTTDANGTYLLRSSMAQIHFKRCIVDEGHKLGNSTMSSKSDLHLVLDCLHISARWIVTGTPSKGLFGVDDSPNTSPPGTPSSDSSRRERRLVASSLEQEKSDLKRIGSIATLYLKARPWANSMAESGDTPADWSLYVLQPRFSGRGSGRKDCLKVTLESLIIRHHISEVSRLLPVVDEKMVYLDGSYQDKLSLNLFSMMIIFNAVQSQRTDQDYFFHPRQRKALMQLVYNLRQASFFGGSFFSVADINRAVETAEKFLSEGKIQISKDDESLLRSAIEFGHVAARNHLKIHANMFHEMPIYVENFPGGFGKAWSIDQTEGDPVCTDSPMIRELQRYLQPTEDAPHSLQMLFNSGAFEARGSAERTKAIEAEMEAAPTNTNGTGSSGARLAGNTQLGQDSNTPRRRKSTSLTPSAKAEATILVAREVPENEIAEPLARTQIISTTSAKLSYLIDEVVKYQKDEQIIIFYENDNVAYYLAGMLEVVSTGVYICQRRRHISNFMLLLSYKSSISSTPRLLHQSDVLSM
jgi:hypothetical protein